MGCEVGVDARRKVLQIIFGRESQPRACGLAMARALSLSSSSPTLIRPTTFNSHQHTQASLSSWRESQFNLCWHLDILGVDTGLTVQVTDSSWIQLPFPVWGLLPGLLLLKATHQLRIGLREPHHKQVHRLPTELNQALSDPARHTQVGQALLVPPSVDRNQEADLPSVVVIINALFVQSVKREESPQPSDLPLSTLPLERQF